jgi:LPPG:FO 2-phospho-L-lactate transferase
MLRSNLRPVAIWGKQAAMVGRAQDAQDRPVKVVALAGGVGAGKFLRGLVRVVAPHEVTVVVNTGDDILIHGLHVSPDLDSVTYWLAGLADRDRGWGREGETFRATDELRRIGAEGAWFGLGDLDLATHLARTGLLAAGRTLSEATAVIAGGFGVASTILPMSDDPVETRVEVVDERGEALDLHFQEYWVARGARDQVKEVRSEGASRAEPAPGILSAIGSADAILLCPSNPIVSIDPILSVPGVAAALATRRERAAGVSPIVRGAPLRGMADRLLPSAGVEVSASGVARHYSDRGLISGWVIDDLDRELAGRVRALGLRVAVTDTIMTGDDAAEALARVALEMALG